MQTDDNSRCFQYIVRLFVHRQSLVLAIWGYKLSRYDEEKSLFYYRSRNDKEVDFVIRKGAHVEQLIQVSYDISNERTLKRELAALVECAEELHCDNLLLITFDTEDTVVYNGRTYLLSLSINGKAAGDL